MTLPTNSAGPAAPTDSSAIDGPLGLGNAEQEIRNWIVALSPNGATAYDTGWVNISVNQGFSAQSGLAPQVRRIGKLVTCRGAIDSTGLSPSTTHIPLNVPAGFRPNRTGYFPVAGNSATTAGQAQIVAGGDLYVRTSSVVAVYYAIDSLSWVVD